MAGLLPPSSGSVMLAGKPVIGPRRDIGMMFQQATLFPWRTTIENVVLPIEIRDGKAAARAKHEEARALLELVGLTGFDDVYPERAVRRHGAARRDLPDADHRAGRAAARRAVQRARRADAATS